MSTEPTLPKPSLRIDELAITNFRTFHQRTVIPLRGPDGKADAVAVFHGDNGAGKSNAMAALDLFFQTASLCLRTRTDDGGIMIPWDNEWTIQPNERTIVVAYRDRPHGSEGPMLIEVAFADARLGRVRATYTPSGDHVRVELGRASSAPTSSVEAPFSPVPKGERDQLVTWLLTPRGPGSRPLTVLDARRHAQWQPGGGHRSLMLPEVAETLFALGTSRKPEDRARWRAFVALLHRFEAFRGKEVSMERPPARGQLGPLAPELVVEERGRAVLALDELSSGEQQVIVLAAVSLLGGSGILAMQEPEVSLDLKNQHLLRTILDEIATEGLVDQVLLESHVPTFDGDEVVRFTRRADGTSEVARAPAVDEERRQIAQKARELGGEQRWITRDGYTLLPDEMRRDLRLTDGGHVWFVKGPKHWEAWPEAELDELFGFGDEGGRDG